MRPPERPKARTGLGFGLGEEPKVAEKSISPNPKTIRQPQRQSQPRPRPAQAPTTRSRTVRPPESASGSREPNVEAKTGRSLSVDRTIRPGGTRTDGRLVSQGKTPSAQVESTSTPQKLVSPSKATKSSSGSRQPNVARPVSPGGRSSQAFENAPAARSKKSPVPSAPEPHATPSPLDSESARSSVVSDQSAERFAERAQTRRRNVRRPYLIGSVIVAILAMAAWVVFFSPFVALDSEQVSISGIEQSVDESHIREIVEKYVGEPLARLDTEAIVADLSKISGVRSARIARSWPSGLNVAIESRTPVAAIPQDEGVALVDQDGVRVGRADEPPENLPKVAMSLDDKRAKRTLNSALTVLSGIPEAMRADIEEVSATSPDAVRMTLRDGKTVVWGDAKDIALKVAVLESLRAQAVEVSEYDVSAPRSPVTR